VLIHAGVDPLTGQRMYLSESTSDDAAAQRILNRLVAQVDEQRHAKIKATFRAATEARLRVHEVEATTREGYEACASTRRSATSPSARSAPGYSRSCTPSCAAAGHGATAAPSSSTASPARTNAAW
jgi:hypothetical protein